MPLPRVAIVGAGGVGGYLAVLLDATADVHLVDTGAHLRALQSDGVTVRSLARGELRAHPPATDQPTDVGPVDVVLYCVKTYDNGCAMPRLRPLLGPDTTVVTLQNGIGNVEQLAALYGPERVVGGALVGGGTRRAPGVVEHVLPPAAEMLELGALVAEQAQRAEAVVRLLQPTGLAVAGVAEIQPVLWTKLLGMAALASVGCLTRTATAGWREHPAARDLYARLVSEAADVARAERIGLASGILDQVMTQPDRLGPAHRTSMQADLERGERLEVDAIQGELVRRGLRNAVPVPAYQTVYAVLRHADDAARAGRRGD